MPAHAAYAAASARCGAAALTAVNGSSVKCRHAHSPAYADATPDYAADADAIFA
jgi:hypothetical protein